MSPGLPQAGGVEGLGTSSCDTLDPHYAYPISQFTHSVAHLRFYPYCSQSSVLSEHVEAVSEQVNAMEVDAVISHLRSESQQNAS